ncbi:MAG: minor capsid protein [Lachnospiraceae bacterium]|nr:minor capsid protein [Lachnospiraceae bacterium]
MAGYWEKRYLRDKAVAVNRSEKYIIGEQRKYYAAAQKEIREDIEALYQKFADKEKVTLAEAKRRISRADFSKVDFGKLVDYQIERNRAFREQKDKLPGYVVAAIEKQHMRYESELRAYTKKGQITRLELLDMQISKALLDLYDKNQISMYDCLSQIYEDGYYRSIFAGQKAIGFGKDFTAPNTRAIERAVLNTYNKKGYSKRLYEHCNAFSKDLKENLVVGFVKGESIETMSARISRRLNVSEANARRLVRTETAYVYEQASLQAYRECGIEMYEFMATLDHKTSKPCKELDRKRFLIRDAVPGKNYPPMHPNCRSTTVAAFEDDKVTKRLAKDQAGRYYEVPSDMAYPEWKKKYMGGGSRSTGLQKPAINDTMKPVNLLMKGLQKIEDIKTDEDIKSFAVQFLDNLGIGHSDISVDVRKIREYGYCSVDPATTDSMLYYNEYVLRADDERPAVYRIKTAFHEAFHLSAGGRPWDGLASGSRIQKKWKSLEETFAEASAHYLLEQYGVYEKVALSYSEDIVKNLPRLKQLDKYSSCLTIQDFGEIAFADRKNGSGAFWSDLSNKIRKIKLAENYYEPYHSYMIDHEDELFDMWLASRPGDNKHRQKMKEDLKTAMRKKPGLLSHNEKMVYYNIMSCAMQKVGIK